MRGSRAIAAAVLLALASGAVAAPAKRVPRAVAAAESTVTPVPLPDTPEVEALRRAYHFAFPVYEMMRTRAETLARANAFGIDGVNKLLPKPRLADASDREVTTPNNDTLYASAWLDLSAGPVALDVPALPGRYNSAALMSLFTDNVAIVGTSSGGKGGSYWIAGPGWTGTPPPGTTVLTSPTNDAWLLLRVLVDGPRDFDMAMASLRQFALNRAGDAALSPPAAKPVPQPDGATFLAVVNEALGRSPSPARATGFADAGIRPGVADAWSALPPATQALWTRALPAFRAELKDGLAAVATKSDGWAYPGPEIGEFGVNDRARAAVALGGLAALPRREAVYLTAAADAAGEPLTGTKAYTVRIPSNVPARGFWSLTLYEVAADGRLFFAANPDKRYAVGNRSPQLHFERDGSLDVFVQTGRPSGERVVNWLPAPRGQFRLVFRAYLPGAELIDGGFRLPPVAVTEVIP